MNVDLEKFCIIQPCESAWLPPYDGKWQQLRPDRSRKVERKTHLHGATLEPGDEIRHVQEIAELVDKRSLSDLQKQAKDAMTQMLYRAHCGDRDALLQYVLHTRASVASLRTLANHLPGKVRARAETFSDWPVLLSLNPQDITSAKQELKSLGVGTPSPLPTKPGQRWDRRNFWTRLAEQAVTACADNKRRVPALKALSAGAKAWRETIKFWGIRVNATYYMLANGDTVMITDRVEQALRSRPRTTVGERAKYYRIPTTQRGSVGTHRVVRQAALGTTTSALFTDCAGTNREPHGVGKRRCGSRDSQFARWPASDDPFECSAPTIGSREKPKCHQSGDAVPQRGGSAG